MSFNYSKKYFYEKNDWLYEPEVNLLYEEVLKMPFADFEKWVAFFRELAVRVWNETGAPPRIGVDESERLWELVANFAKYAFNYSHCLHANTTVITKENGEVEKLERCGARDTTVMP